ncbi:hypothetical protein AAY473_016956 [Plecturocebus cupreus]
MNHHTRPHRDYLMSCITKLISGQETVSHYAAQAGLEFLGSSNPPASAFQSYFMEWALKEQEKTKALWENKSCGLQILK